MSDKEQAPTAKPDPKLSTGDVRVSEPGTGLTRTISTASHGLIADEPSDHGGADLGPNPYELLLASLGACTSMTIRMYAERKQWPLDNVDITLRHSRIHARDCKECESASGYVDRIEKRIVLSGSLDDEQRKRLLDIADRCPVHKTLGNEILISTELMN